MTEPDGDCLVFPFSAADGPRNMARDEAMLDLVGEDSRAAAFRAYAWSEPTLSLGYFQGHDEVARDPRWRGLSLVRRSTGGGAIVHHHEVTYCLVIPRRHPLARQPSALYRGVHQALAEMLSQGGPVARRRGEPDAGAWAGVGAGAGRPFLCFNDRDPEDLVVDTEKVVGSAQRRRSGAVLQHGSILLARSEFAPELNGLGEDPPSARALAEWGDRLARVIPGALGFRAVEGPWTEALEARAAVVERETYRNAAWMLRR